MGTLNDWVARVSENASNRKIAGDIGRPYGAVSRWLREEQIPPTMIVLLARTYGADPIEGLVHSGLVTEDERLHSANEGGVITATDGALAREVLRRTELRTQDEEAYRNQIRAQVRAEVRMEIVDSLRLTAELTA